MRLDFEIGYDLRGRRPGKSSHRPLRFAEPASVVIREVGSLDAPIAVEWGVRRWSPAHTGNRDRHAYACDDRGRQFTRFYEGRHYLRLVEAHMEFEGRTYQEEARDLTAATALEALRQGRGFDCLGLGNYKTVGYPAKKIKRVASDPTDEFESVTKSKRDKAMGAVERVGDDVLCIDGVVHVACAQPGVRLSRSFLSTETRSDLLDGLDSYLNGHLAFGLSEWRGIAAGQVKGAGNRDLAIELDEASPRIFLDESMDPDIDRRRAVDTIVKRVLRENPYTPEMAADIGKFFGDEAPQRYDAVSDLLDRIAVLHGMPEYRKAEVLERVLEIEDGMSVDIGMVIGLSAPRP